PLPPRVTAIAADVAIAVARGPVPEFAPYTFPRYRKHLAEPNGNAVAVTARLEGRPIGLALLERDATSRTMRLLSLAVGREYGQRGIGSRLLRDCAAPALRGHADTQLCFYSNTLPEVAAFEGALARAGWMPPELAELRVALRCGDTRQSIARWPGM